MSITPPELLAYLGDVGVVAISIGYFWGKFFQGSNKEQNDAINLLEKRVKIFETELKEAQSQITEQSKEIARLHGVIEEKEKTLAMLKDVFAGRDPEFSTFMAEVRAAISESRNNWNEFHKFARDLDQLIKVKLELLEKAKS